MKLNISLYRNDTTRFEDCLRPRTAKRKYIQIGEGQTGVGGTYRIYLASSQAKVPPWVDVIRNHVQPGTLDRVANQIQGAAIVLQVPTADGLRFFAVTHGHGHHLMDRERLELGFGLRAVLNAIDPGKLNLMDSRNMEAQARQKRVASSASTTLGALGFEPETEILRIAGGLCLDQSLGVQVDGSDSMHLTVKDVKFEELGDKCRALHDIYRKDTYKEWFGFIDHVGIVKDSKLRRALEDRLAAALQACQSDGKIALVCPDQIDLRDCVWYEMWGLPRTAPIRAELSLPVLYDYLRDVRNGPGIEREHLRKVKLIGLNEDGEQHGPMSPLLAYLVFETEHDRKRYVLSNEKWYEVDGAYLEGIRASLDGIPRCSSPPILPWAKVCLDGEWRYHEGEYNKLYEQDNDFLVLDRKPFAKFDGLQGHSQVEIADLFHLPTKKLLCVKRWTRSSTMSHLLAQASVSAQLLWNHPPYRDELLGQIRKKWPALAMPADPREYVRDMAFVYVIGTESLSRDLHSLPVFSQVNMVKHVRRIQGAGFTKVEVGWAPMVSAARSSPPAPRVPHVPARGHGRKAA